MRAVAAVIACAAAALAGCGEKGEPRVEPAGGDQVARVALELPAVCEDPERPRGIPPTRTHPIAAGRVIDGGDRIRVVYVSSGSLRPCALEARERGDDLQVSVLVPNLGAVTDDLRTWCAEAPAAKRPPPGAAVVNADPHPNQERLIDQETRRRTLGAGRDCELVPLR